MDKEIREKIFSLWERINKREHEILDYRKDPNESKKLRIQSDLNLTNQFFWQHSGKLSNDAQDKFRELFEVLQNGLLLEYDFSEFRKLKDEFWEKIKEIVGEPRKQNKILSILKLENFSRGQKIIIVIACITSVITIFGWFINDGGKSSVQMSQDSPGSIQIYGDNNNLNTPTNASILFKYNYSAPDRFFYVSSNPEVQISKVEWVIASKWNNGTTSLDNHVTDFLSLGDFPTKLSRSELEDVLSMNAGISTLTEFGKDLLQCVLLPYAQNGIPMLINVTYKESVDPTQITESNLALLARLDTPYPEFVPGQQNVKDNKEVIDYFNKYIYSLDFAIKQVKEQESKFDKNNYSGQLRNYKGECAFKLNQPINGY